MFNEVCEGGGWLQAAWESKPSTDVKHESMELLASILMSTPSPQSVLIFFTWEVSRSTALAHKCAFSLGYFHRLWRL